MTNGFISTVERIDDIPLLLAQMDKIQLATLLDKHFPMHGHWKGLGLGHVVQVWLAYILSSTTRIKGLVRLLSIGLRILCLLEFTVREALQQRQEKLSGIYKGNHKRSTARPTAEMMLKVFRGISLVSMNINGVKYIENTPLTPVQARILTVVTIRVRLSLFLMLVFCATLSLCTIKRDYRA